MTNFFDLSTLDEATRLAAADHVRTLTDFKLPELKFFNSGPCGDHAAVDPRCRRCGVTFRKHQRVGVAWLYLRRHGLIADQVGLGKTAQAAGLLAAMAEAGEFAGGQRALVVCRPAALSQWVAELRRFLPSLTVVDNTGTQKQRTARYGTAFHVLVTGFQMLLRDSEQVDAMSPMAAVVVDDVDSLRNRQNRSAAAIKRIARQAKRVVVLNGTPLQKKLREMHSMLDLVGGREVFGTESAFRRQYEREEFVSVYNSRLGRKIATRQTVGYKNIDDFVKKLSPLVLRRTADHVDDVSLPTIMPPHNIFLDLHPAQRAKYEDLRKGVLQVLKGDHSKIKRLDAISRFLYGAQICSGLVTLGEEDKPNTSCKLDWVENMLIDGDLSDEKVVVFCQFTNTVAALSARLQRGGVGHALIWGRDNDKGSRKRAQDRFWDDPKCRVLIGTTAIEQSLNLQISRHLINVDQIMNPARMQQLAGRIRRDGSTHKKVFIHNLFARGTQEEGYLDVLEREQALADVVWGEQNQLYEALSPLHLLQLIGRSQ